MKKDTHNSGEKTCHSTQLTDQNLNTQFLLLVGEEDAKEQPEQPDVEEDQEEDFLQGGVESSPYYSP